MKNGERIRAGAALAVLGLLTVSLSGCANGSAASAPKPTPTHAATVAARPTARPTHATAPAPSAKPVNVGGAWVYKVSDTNEVLHLRQHKNGAVSGSGFSDRKIAQSKIAHSAIDVANGRVHNGALTLSLYITQVNWGSGLTIVENLRCSATAKVLHCLMDAPIYRVHNIKQDFYRR